MNKRAGTNHLDTHGAGEEKEGFLDLAKRMLVWYPDSEKRQANWQGILFFQPEQTNA
ncbi:unnamed protein product [Penicillium roqueforti FM164]|uniref:Genomic scaffold, ProqFM164S02 n=1 Tax=Penicillium roqueforti (strain FM164) TaxID=1365484 RepID=W6Q8D1_PENRF|nr:unnamed protein product [Penicillium roqueforti FM164]